MARRIPKVYATRFFQLITSRQFAEAERILERVKQKMHASDRNRGYFQAMYGMLLTMKNSDRYAFLSTLDLSNGKILKSYRHEFLSHTENRLHDDYDRGYFEAWADYMRILQKIKPPAPAANNKNSTKTPQETTPEATVSTEKTEPRIEDKSGEYQSREKSSEPGQRLLVEYPEA